MGWILKNSHLLGTKNNICRSDPYIPKSKLYPGKLFSQPPAHQLFFVSFLILQCQTALSKDLYQRFFSYNFQRSDLSYCLSEVGMKWVVEIFKVCAGYALWLRPGSNLDRWCFALFFLNYRSGLTAPLFWPKKLNPLIDQVLNPPYSKILY